MIHCEKCNCTPMDRPFMRMNEKGVDGIFWCEECAKKYEPELYKNEMEDRTQAEKDIINICYGRA